MEPDGAQMPTTSAHDTLLKSLEEDGDSYFSGGVWNNVTDLSLTVVTVLASLVAAILASTDAKEISRWVIAGVAAVPAAAASLQRIIGMRERSNWYFMHAAEVRALATKLRYANAPDVEEFARQRAEMEVEMERGWLQATHPKTRSGRVRSRGIPDM